MVKSIYDSIGKMTATISGITRVSFRLFSLARLLSYVTDNEKQAS